MATKPTEKTAATAIQEAQATIKAAIQSLTAQAAEKQALINGYRAEVHALNQASISFEDYAGYVRKHMRESAASILDGFRERILSSISDRTPMNKVPMADFEEGAGVFQDGPSPACIEQISHWNMLCFLGGKAFEDAFIEKLRADFEGKWDWRLPKPIDIKSFELEDDARHLVAKRVEDIRVMTIPVAQRLERIAELNQLIDQEQAAKRVIDADLQALLA